MDASMFTADDLTDDELLALASLVNEEIGRRAERRVAAVLRKVLPDFPADSVAFFFTSEWENGWFYEPDFTVAPPGTTSLALVPANQCLSPDEDAADQIVPAIGSDLSTLSDSAGPHTTLEITF